MSANQTATSGDFHEQELRIALVMNGGVSLAVWIGGVTQEINRLLRGEGIYGRLCRDLALRPRVDVITGTSAGGINGALLALAISQGKSLDPVRDIWRDTGDILALLRQSTEDDPPSLLDGGYFYRELLKGFEKIGQQPGQMRSAADAPIDLTLTTTVLRGEVRDFPDDVGTLIRDVTHRGLIKFRRGPDIVGDPFADRAAIVAKLATAARATASFPGAFEPFYLPHDKEEASAGGATVAHLDGHARFKLGCFVVDGGVLDNTPLESAIDAVFQQRAEGEVRRVLAYVVPDPGHIPDPPSQAADRIPTMASTVLASLVSIPRVESVSDQLRAIAQHNQKVGQQRDTRLLVAQSLHRDQAGEIARAFFKGYRQRRMQSAADYIACALAEGAAGQGIALGRRARQQIAQALIDTRTTPWVPDDFDAPALSDWQWGMFTLGNIMSVVLDMLRRGVGLMPARHREDTGALWTRLMEARRQAYDLIAEITALRSKDLGYWRGRGQALAPQLSDLERGAGQQRLTALIESELRQWARLYDETPSASLAPRAFGNIAEKVSRLLVASLPALREVLALAVPARAAKSHDELKTLVAFFSPPPESPALDADAACRQLLTLEVVHYAFGADTTRDQYLELVQFSANVPTAFGGPARLEDKLSGVQLAHFGAFYKRSWRINDWMFGRLDGAERLVRILINPSRLARLYGSGPGANPDAAIDSVLTRLRATVFDGIQHETDRKLLAAKWEMRLPAMRGELAFLNGNSHLPEYLAECSAMVLERLHLDILREELPVLADAVGDDELDGGDLGGNGPKFLKRLRHALNQDCAPGDSGRTLPAETIVRLFKDANVGQEKLLDEAGTDRFTIAATRSAAVAVSALAGKSSGLKRLSSVFAVVRAPLVALDLLVRALSKRSKTHVFAALYGMLMAASAAILIAQPAADAKWPTWVTTPATGILAAGLIVGLRRRPKLLLSILLLAGALWLLLPLIRKCLA